VCDARKMHHRCSEGDARQRQQDNDADDGGCRRICAMLLPALEMLQNAGVGGGAVSGAVQGAGLLSACGAGLHAWVQCAWGQWHERGLLDASGRDGGRRWVLQEREPPEDKSGMQLQCDREGAANAAGAADAAAAGVLACGLLLLVVPRSVWRSAGAGEAAAA
jgi:hypothetical protein